MMMRYFLFSVLIIICFGSKAQSLYFPPLIGKTWETLSPDSLGWCANKTDSLYDFLQTKNTRGFVVLKDGKIVLEKYFGTFTQDSFWYWASAGKTMTSFLVGIAQQKTLFHISDTSSKYLGKPWTSLSVAKEDLIKIRNQLSMTSGLDDNGVNKDCTYDSCLTYKADAGSRWAYHNAPYTLLDQVIENSSGQSFQQFFNAEVRNKTGINGIWLKPDFNNVLYSNTRSMARFGLLLLNKGVWDQTGILNDTGYFYQMTHASQNLNPAYGYLTWLNGTDKFMAPGSQFVFPGMLAPNAPADMFSAMGKNGQLINVVPSMKLVMVRVGDAPGDNGEVPITFNNDIWFYLNKVICSGSNVLAESGEPVRINMYPNPAHSELHFEGFPIEDKCLFRLVNLQGEVLIQQGMQSTIDISQLPAAYYFISIESEKGIQYKSFVKN